MLFDIVHGHVQDSLQNIYNKEVWTGFITIALYKLVMISLTKNDIPESYIPVN